MKLENRLAFSPAEAAKMLNLSRTMIYKLIDKNKLKVRQVQQNNRVFISAKSVFYYLNKKFDFDKSDKYNLSTAAKILGTTRQTIYALIKERYLKTEKGKQCVYIKHEELEIFLKEGEKK